MSSIDCAKIATWSLFSMGVSADTVSVMRKSNPNPSWQQRVAAVKSEIQGQNSKLPQAAVHFSPSNSEGSALKAAPSSTAQPNRTVAIQMSPDRFKSVLPLKDGHIGPPQPKSKGLSSSDLNKSKLKASDAVLVQAVDFNAIADSSTGGSGINRPYGAFSACRNGDGTAIWERIPPQPRGWIAKLTAPQETSTSRSVEDGVSQDRSSNQRRQSRDPTRVRQSTVSRPVLPRPYPALTPEHMSQPRLSSSMGNLTPSTTPRQIPPGLKVGGESSFPPLFALPCATFLTEMPTLPPHVRVDLGTAAERNFLQSGLRGEVPSGTEEEAAHGTKREYSGVFVPVDRRTLQSVRRQDPPSMLIGPSLTERYQQPLQPSSPQQELQQPSSPSPSTTGEDPAAASPSRSVDNALPRVPSAGGAELSLALSSGAGQRLGSGRVQLPVEKTLPRRFVPPGL